jgi:hypothetical protein
MSAQREPLELSRHFSPEESERLRQGHVPESQDDRWFVYVDDDDVVHVHRSWTGQEIYAVELQPSGDGYDVAAAWVNRDPEQNPTAPELDAVLLPALLEQLARE